MCRANRLVDEHGEAEGQRRDALQDEPPVENHGRPPSQDRDASRGSHQEPRWMVRVAESHEVGAQDDQAVSLGAVRVVAPPHDEPRYDGEEQERDRVHLLIHDRLVPYRECSRPDQNGNQCSNDPLPALAEPAYEHALRDEEPRARGQRAAQGCQNVDPHCRPGRYWQQREHAAQEHKKRIPRRVRNPEHICRGDVLAGVPHCGRRGQREEIEYEDEQCCDARGEVRGAVIERSSFRGGGGHKRGNVSRARAGDPEPLQGVSAGTSVGPSAPWRFRAR